MSNKRGGVAFEINFDDAPETEPSSGHETEAEREADGESQGDLNAEHVHEQKDEREVPEKEAFGPKSPDTDVERGEGQVDNKGSSPPQDTMAASDADETNSSPGERTEPPDGREIDTPGTTASQGSPSNMDTHTTDDDIKNDTNNNNNNRPPSGIHNSYSMNSLSTSGIDTDFSSASDQDQDNNNQKLNNSHPGTLAVKKHRVDRRSRSEEAQIRSKLMTPARVVLPPVPASLSRQSTDDSARSSVVSMPGRFTGKSTLTGSNTVSSAANSEAGGEEDDTINVVVRVRPINRSSQNSSNSQDPNSQRRENGTIQFPGDGALWIDSGTVSKTFTFNVTFEPEASQADVFEHSGIKRLIEMALNGYSCTAFAFGQTGSGKTHTITGPPSLFDEGGLDTSQCGLIPRSFHYLFQLMNQEPRSAYRITASYLEIYNEQVVDLLNPNQGHALTVRWSKNKGFYVENLFAIECETIDDLIAVLEEGLANRATGANSVNEHSSRSHSMLTLQIDSEVQDPHDENLYITKHGKLTFVDLAGSEKVKNETNTTAGHLLESNNINKSLLVLGNCISALGDPKRKQGHIPYRDSKLTKLLADSLGGNGVTLMIACVSPAVHNAAESLNTLRYANRAKKIKTKPVIKMDPREKLIMSLKREVKILRQENHYLRNQLEFPVKPRGQLQKENDKRFLQLLQDQNKTGQKVISDHGLYEMLQEYMIENESLRTENSDLHQMRDVSKREQQILARENEKLARKLDAIERERMFSQTPMSIYSVNSSRHGSANQGIPMGGTGPWPGGQVFVNHSRDSSAGSWASQPMRSSVPGQIDSPMGTPRGTPRGTPGMAPVNGYGPSPQHQGYAARRTPPAHLQHPMKPPHRLSEPVHSPNQSIIDSPRPGYSTRYQHQQDFYRDNPPGGGSPAYHGQQPQFRPTQQQQQYYGPPPGAVPNGVPNVRGAGPGGTRLPQPAPGNTQRQGYQQRHLPNKQQHPPPPPPAPAPAPRKSRGSDDSLSIPSDHASATLSSGGSVPRGDPNDLLRQELFDLEGQIRNQARQNFPPEPYNRR